MARIAKHSDAARADEFTRGEGESAFEAKTGRTDAINSGIVKNTNPIAQAEIKGAIKSGHSVRDVLGHNLTKAGKDDTADAGDQAANNAARQAGISLQSHRNMKTKITALAAAELDEADETQGVSDINAHAESVQTLTRKVRELRHTHRSQKSKSVANPVTKTTSKTSENSSLNTKSFGVKDSKAKASQANKRLQSRRTWLRARASQAQATQAASQSAAKAAGTKTIATVASSAAAPVAGVIAGVIAFVLAMMVVSQLISALFGFWENEASKQSLEGLPPYITQEMVLTALECQEKYGHPAGCTIAQIIAESGQGDHLSGLAIKDNNLFGIKWASSYGLAAEVSGHSSWQTGEEYDGQNVTIIAEFTSFKSHKDCIVFRSRVFLQNSRYADNPLIKEAIENHDSDKMAEGLKDAGYATDSSYVASLKSIMQTYNLYRFDGMSVEQFKSAAASSDAIVAAAYSQLGVPYVWGGTTPNVGLDCSGLTQYCYSVAGISIPRNSEAQHAAGTSIPISEAQPGDILWKVGHVAIYIGGDQYIHEPQTGDVCRIANGINYFTCAVRFR